MAKNSQKKAAPAVRKNRRKRGKPRRNRSNARRARTSGHLSGIRKAELRPEQLRRFCDPGALPFETTDDLQPLKGILSQRRALRAIEFGLRIRKRGYNIFTVGAPGSGKTTTVRRILKNRSAKEKTPPDICYVYNFEDPSRPKVLLLPPGKGQVLAKNMEQLVEELKKQLPKIVGSGSLALRRAEMMARFRLSAERALRRLILEARKKGLWVQEDEDRLLITPVVDGEPIGPDEFEQMPAEVKQVLEQKVLTFQQRTAAFERLRHKTEREMGEAIEAEERQAIEPYLAELVEELKRGHKGGGEPVSEYLDQVRGFVMENHRRFLPGEEVSPKESGEGRSAEEGTGGGASSEDGLAELQVNVLVNRSRQKGAPVVVEPNPTVANLAGYLEYREQLGALQTDHMLIRGGALHRANGGYLVLQGADLLNHASGWEALKRSINISRVNIEESREEGQHRLAGTVIPEAVPLDVKVVIIGTLESYSSFQGIEPEFDRMFKVKAEFEDYVVRNGSNVMKLSRFLALVAKEENYMPLHRGAVAEIVEFASRLADDQGRLSTQIAAIVDLVSEGDHWARRAGRKVVAAEHVRQALKERNIRHSRVADSIFDEIRQKQLFIDTRGSVVGQINGLAVYDMGDLVFGIPSRITARTYVGQRGVVNIDREVKLSGAIHDKGALILVGYLGGRFAQAHPLTLSASITFEQSYEEVEGDSASTSELFALLSSLADVPIQQAVAATGSVNQKGELQPIGAVNEKIEGVYHVCKARGLTGEQGVIIPRANVRHLMLKPEVIQAVSRRKFHIWAVGNVDKGMEILTGVPAGQRRRDGSWTPGSLNDRVSHRLAEIAYLVKGAPEK